MPRKLILYIAQSLDGYIAAPNDNLDFLNTVALEGEDYGYSTFISTVDTVLIGRKTYDWVLKQAGNYPNAENKKVYVITRQEKEPEGNIIFSNERLKSLVHWLKYAEEEQSGKDIFCDGGAELVNALLQDDLIDEMIISVLPILIGNGTKLFQDDRTFRKLELIKSQTFETGLVQVHYKCLISKEEWLEKIRTQLEYLISISDSEGVKLLDERLSEIIVEEPEKFQCKFGWSIDEKTVTMGLHFLISTSKKQKNERLLVEKMSNILQFVAIEDLARIEYGLWKLTTSNPISIYLHNFPMLELKPNLWAVGFDFRTQNLIKL